jgi:phosphoribosylpyrophosphate synthetase
MQQQDRWHLVLCSGAEHLGDALAREGFMVYRSAMNYDGSRKFANGDVYTALPEVDDLSGKRVCVIQSFTSSGELDRTPFTTADRLVETLQVLKILQEPATIAYSRGGRRAFSLLQPPAQVVVLCLHMAFSKQDQLYRPGEVNASKQALDLLYSGGASQVVALDPHVPVDFPWIQNLIQEGRFVVLSMYKSFVDSLLAQDGNSDVYFVSTPGKRRTPLGVELQEISKERISTHEVLLGGRVDETIAGKQVCLLDDMAISGTTIKNARRLFINQGAAEVLCWVTHALPYAPGNEDNLRDLYHEYEGKIFVSDTVRTRTFESMYPYCRRSCVPAVASFLRGLEARPSGAF